MYLYIVIEGMCAAILLNLPNLPNLPLSIIFFLGILSSVGILGLDSFQVFALKGCLVGENCKSMP